MSAEQVPTGGYRCDVCGQVFAFYDTMIHHWYAAHGRMQDE